MHTLLTIDILRDPEVDGEGTAFVSLCRGPASPSANEGYHFSQRLHHGEVQIGVSPIMHVRFLSPDVAMMHSEFHIYGDVDEPVRTGIGTRVVRKIDSRWRTVAVQNTDVRVGGRH